jgi:hypothetical protein
VDELGGCPGCQADFGILQKVINTVFSFLLTKQSKI